MRKRGHQAGITVIEVVAAFLVVVVVVGMFLPLGSTCRKSPRIKCVNNLKNVGLAFRIFVTDNNDRFPAEVMLTNGVPLADIDALRVYLMLSNELSTPKVLNCPVDKRQEAESFKSETLKNISYFASLSANERMPQAFLAGDRNLKTNGLAVGPWILALTEGTELSWTKELHQEQGNIAMGDGSVEQFDSMRLKQGVKDHSSEMATNYLAVP